MAQAGSPRTRGSTAGGAVHVPRYPGFPAHAGINRPRLSRPRPDSGVPRARGDQPHPHTVAMVNPAGSPRTRGSTVHGYSLKYRSCGFPAHAGINRARDAVRPALPRVPRARGDQPTCRGRGKRFPKGSPRTRGSTADRGRADRVVDGFPAHAGINRQTGAWWMNTSRVPRARGDQPFGGDPTDSLSKGSPRTRGSTADRGRADRVVDGFPAHAGINRQTGAWWMNTSRVPRARGDQPFGGDPTDSLSKGSPRTRGSTGTMNYEAGKREGFPAHAGINRRCNRYAKLRSRVPRARGDQPT